MRIKLKKKENGKKRFENVEISFSKRAAAFAIMMCYSFMIVPAKEFLMEREDSRQIIERYAVEREEISEIEKNAVENALNGEIAGDDVFWGEYEISDGTLKNETYDSMLLIHKSRLYELLLKAKEEFFQEKKENNLSDAEFENQWKEISEKIVSDYISENDISDKKEISDVQNDYSEMERRIYNEVLYEMLYDENSIQNISEKTNAGAVAEKLISDAEESSKIEIDSLFEQFDKISECDDEVLVLEKENWFEKFEKFIQDGIERWQKVENDFLTAKFEYENEAGEKYAENVQKWEEAYDELLLRKENWKNEIETKLEEGLLLWQQKTDALDEEIKNAMEVYKNELFTEKSQKSKEFEINCEIYTATRSLLSIACNEVENWFANWSDKYDGLYSYWKTEDNEEPELNPLNGSVKIDGTNCDKLKKIINDVKNKYTFTVQDIRDKNDDETNRLYRDYLDEDQILFYELDLVENWIDIISEYSVSLNETVSNFEKAGFNYSDGTFVLSDFNTEKKYLEDKLKAAEMQVEKTKTVFEYSTKNKVTQEEISNIKNKLDKASEKTDLANKEYEITMAKLENAISEYNKAFDDLQDQKEVTDLLLSELKNARDEYDKQKLNKSLSELNDIKTEYLSIINSMNSIINNSYVQCLFVIKLINSMENHNYIKIYNDAKDAIAYQKSAHDIEYTDDDGKKKVLHTKSLDELKEELKDINLKNGLTSSHYSKRSDVPDHLWIDDSEVLAQIHNKEEIISFLTDGKFLSVYDDVNYEKIVELYGSMSPDYLLSKDREVKTKIFDCICEFKGDDEKYYINKSDEELDVFYEKLNQICEESLCSDFIKSEVSMYMNEISKERNQVKDSQKRKENENEIAKIFGNNINVNLIEYNVANSELFFNNSILEYELDELREIQKYESYAHIIPECTDEYEMEYSREYKELTEVIFGLENEYVKYSKQLEIIEKKLIQANSEYTAFLKTFNEMKDRMESFESEYSEAMEKYNGNSDESYFNIVIEKMNAYNQLVDEINNKLKNLEDCRNEEDVLRDLYEYAQNEYLFMGYDYENGTSPEERYQFAVDEFNKIQKELTELENKSFNYQTEFVLIDENGNNLFEQLKKISQNFSASEMFSYEIETKISEELELLYNAQIEEKILLNEIVKETSPEEYTLSDMVKAFVEVKEINGSYLITINENSILNIMNENDPDSDLNSNNSESILDKPYKFEDECKKYVTDKCIELYEENGKPVKISMAENECAKFLKSLDNKSYKIDDLLLAECYLKMQFDEKSLYLEGEDPLKNQNYSLDSIIDNMMGISIYDEYKERRIESVKNAYMKVLSNDGLDDLAKFILYSEYSISDVFDLLEREKNCIAVNALKGVNETLQLKANEYQGMGVGFAAAATAMAAVACVPVLCFFAAPAAASYVASASYFRAASDIGDCIIDINSIIDGYNFLIKENSDSSDSIVENLIEQQSFVEEQTKKINTYIYGNEEISDSEMEFDSFETQIKALLNISEDNDENQFYIDNLISNLNGIDSFEQLYYEACKNKSCKTIIDAVECISDYINLNYVDTVNLINNCVQDKRDDSEWNEALFLREYGIVLYENLVKNVPVQLNREQESYIKVGLNNLKSCYENLLTEYYVNLRNQKQSEFDLQKEKLNSEIDEWISDIRNTKRIADIEWEKAEENFARKFSDWNKEWLEAFEQKENEWNADYENLLKEKAEWIDYNYTKQAVSTGFNIDSEIELDNVFEEIEQKTKYILENKDNEYLFKIENINLESITDLSVFNNISTYIDTLNTEALRTALDIFCMNKMNVFDFESSARIEKVVDKLNNDIESLIISQSAQTAFDEIENKLSKILSEVEESNKNLEKWEKNLVLKDGYTYGDEIYRYAIIDSNVLGGNIRKKQTVHKYEYFDCLLPEISFSVKNATSKEMLDFMIEETTKQIQDFRIEIFGDDKASDNEGLFQKHVGFEPEFVQNVNTKIDRVKNISKPGSGQLGLVMLDFIWNAAENSNGYDQMGLPLYEKKLTAENKVLGIELPTVRDITAMVCDIIGNCTGQVWVSAIDDFLFGVMDMQFNQTTSDQFVKNLAKAGATSVLGSVASGAMNVVNSSAMNQVAKLTVNTGIKTAQTYTASIADSYIDAMQFNGGFSIDWNRAGGIWTNDDVIRNSISSGLTYATSSLVNNNLNQLTLTDGIDREINNNFYNVKAVSSLNKTISNLAAAGVEKIVTGKTTVNLLNAKGTGLFELIFDDDGISASFGNDGIDLNSIDAIRGLSGISDAIKTADAKAALSNGNEEKIALINAINCLSYSNSERSKELAKEIWNNDKIVNIKEMKALGRTKDNVIEISDKIAGNNDESAVLIASTLIHEDVHSQGLDEFQARKIGYKFYDDMSQVYDTSAGLYDKVNDIAFFTEAYKQCGEEGLYMMMQLTDAFSHHDDGWGYYFAETIDPEWRQNMGDNGEYKLLDAEEKYIIDQINSIQFDKAYKQYMTDEYDKYILNDETVSLNDKLSYEEFCNSKIAVFEDKETFIKNLFIKDSGLSKYKFDKQSFISLWDYGCVLSTTAYIAYSITGKLYSLKQANDIVKASGEYDGTYITYGKKYIGAVNALAGEQVLSDKFEKVNTNYEMNNLLNEIDTSEEPYFIVARVLGDKHAVLLNSKQNDYVIVDGKKIYKSLNVINPWEKGYSKLGNLNYDISDISNLTSYKIDSNYIPKYLSNIEYRKNRETEIMQKYINKN